MRNNVIRWCIAVLMLAAMAFFLMTPAVAEVEPLDLDLKTHGRPLNEAGWISKTEYQDESIHVTVESKPRKPKSSAGRVTCRWVIITIADPSQIRTTLSNESYEDHTLARSVSMAKSVNAVVACNGDFVKYSYDFGYVIKQGVFYRDCLNGDRDILVIDDRGDFSVVFKATTETMEAHLDELEAGGRKAVNTFSFGPCLVLDGEVQDTAAGYADSGIPTQRIAICQLGELEYAIVEVDGGNGNGMNMAELARYVVELFPNCRVAYNLDGGGSTHLVMRGKMICKTLNSRAISDMIYFASAATGE